MKGKQKAAICYSMNETQYEKLHQGDYGWEFSR